MATPLAQEGSCNSRLCGENRHWNGALAGGKVLRALGNDVVTIQALVLDALVAQELR